eukprot:gene43745-53496_t
MPSARIEQTLSSSGIDEELTDRSHSTNEQLFVRRSVRDPQQALLHTSQVQALLNKIKTNHADTVVLKIKDHLISDINSTVMDHILAALHTNRVCQALYLQNLSRAMQNEQMLGLLALLKRKMIWALNVGENYEVSSDMWEHFCKELPSTNVTHLYVSEHVIPLSLKNQMRAHIRENRRKHNKHCSKRNVDVIARCTNMWWNPINALRHAEQFHPHSSSGGSGTHRAPQV